MLFDRLARRLDYDFVALISAVSSLHVYVAGLKTPVDLTALNALLEPARRLRADPGAPQPARRAFEQAYRRIFAHIRRPADDATPRSLATWVVLSRALDLANRGRATLAKHEMLMNERLRYRRSAFRRSEFSRPLEFRAAIRNGLRTLVAVALGGVVWMYFHDQLQATILMILLSALTTILATLPNPVVAVGGFAKGLAIAAVAAFAVDFLILPQMTGFAMLMLAMLPFFFCAGLAMASPDLSTALPGRISAVMFSLLVHVQNGALPNFSTYIGILMGISMALVLTITAFRVVLPVSSRQLRRERMAGVFKELARGTGGSRARLETRMYDRISRIPPDDGSYPSDFKSHQAIMATVNLGLEARSLVVLSRRARFDADSSSAITREMNDLRRVFTRWPPSLSAMAALQRRTHELAERLIEHAVSIESRARRRIAVRAAVAAELVASALGDYIDAFPAEQQSGARAGYDAAGPPRPAAGSSA